jgi:dTDP-4-dehydrorhamnose 3,5-epimerase
MNFIETALTGAYVVELDKREDERGFFARAFCVAEFKAQNLAFSAVQANMSYSRMKGTLRGMHYQVAPAIEPKFIRCIRGAIWDVIIDMRSDSPTYLEHVGYELSADNRRAIYVPGMFAHGNQSLTDDAELLYLVSAFYAPGCERGVRYDDPVVGIEWPLAVTVINERDASLPLLEGARRTRSADAPARGLTART